MTVSLSNQPQIPVIASGYWAANKHVWVGQWLLMDTQTQEARLPRLAVMLELVGHNEKCVAFTWLKYKKEENDSGQRNICID